MQVNMRNFKAQTLDYKEIAINNQLQKTDIKPYFRDDEGKEAMWLVSPQHGRSFVVDRRDNRWIVGKGNGLSYTCSSINHTPEAPLESWCILYAKEAIRDFRMGMEIASLGIKTNIMEAVVEIDLKLPSDIHIDKKPALLQYSVECPYRISYAPFMDREMIMEYVLEWEKMNEFEAKKYYEITANVLIRNLRIMHDHEILHNALTSQNHTWALELLDFEIACSPSNPYDREDYRRRIPDLYPREIIHIYQIILDIAGILREEADFGYIDKLFNHYGFKI